MNDLTKARLQRDIADLRAKILKVLERSPSSVLAKIQAIGERLPDDLDRSNLEDLRFVHANLIQRRDYLIEAGIATMSTFA